jgi:hypothetical protein
MKSIGRKLVSSSIAAGLMLVAIPAFAQNTERAFQLGLSAPVLRYQTGSLEYDTGAVSTDADVSRTQIGIERNVMVELGYGLTDMFVLGGFVQLAHESNSVEVENADEQEDSETHVVLGPKFDAMFSPGQKLRPFVGGMIGFVSQGTSTENTDSSLSGVALEARGGLRWFPTPGFSLDPALVLGFSALSGENEVDIGPGSADVDVSGSLFHIGINVGFSGWLL